MVTHNYRLRELESSDIKNIYKGLSDHEITQFYDVHFESLKATEEQMDWYNALKKEKTGLWWGIYNIKNNAFCGAAGFSGRDTEHQKAEIGFWLLKEFWGRCILKEVMPRLFEYGFTPMGLNRIEGYVDAENLKCKRALTKVDFFYEGTMRECEIRDGKTKSVAIYSILKSEWF